MIKIQSIFGLTTLVLATSCTALDLEKTADIDVSECAGDADIDDTTFIVWEFEDSVHEMITCGNLTFVLIRALLDSGKDLLTGDAKLPEAFSYEDGAYMVTGDGVAMDMSFTRGANTPGGSSGSRIEHDLFAIDNYLENAQVFNSGDGVEIEFNGVGPLVSLLGKGSNPSSPLTMSPMDLAVFAANLGTLKLDSRIYVDHEHTLSVVQYEIDNSPSLLINLFSNFSMDMDKATATASRTDLSQSLEPTVWNISYVDASNSLEGAIEADVVGGPFDFHVVLDYNPLFTEPDITITCLKEKE
ncbi:MAG: hypothetical protein ACON4U_02150 [Myxococcota bacterium]